MKSFFEIKNFSSGSAESIENQNPTKKSGKKILGLR